ncbi:MAG: glycosyltransferase family 39 protein [Chloroflexi bacterium]|nr:glycosyltransferase family 39 protein [Chloroflexota bacterium]
MSAATLQRPVAATGERAWARPALNVALLALVALHVGVLAYHLIVQLAFPYDLNYGEGYVLNDAVRLAHGHAIYVDLQQFPMVRSPYPPLFPFLWSLLIPLSGPTFLVGRLLEVLSLVGIGVVVAWNAIKVRSGIWPALAAAGLIAGSPFVYQWAGYARVDLLALLFAVGGVVAAQWIRGWRGVVLAAVLCGLALWTKQTAVTAAFAVALALFLRNWRQGLGFIAFVSVPCVGVGALLNLATNGEFVRHVLLGNASNPVLPLRALIYVGTFAVLHLVALFGGGWWLRRALVGRPSPIALYLPVSLLAAFSAGNGGSSVNYLIEPVLALALVVPFAWRALPRASALAGPLFAVIQLAVLFHWPNAFGTTYLAESAIGRTPTAVDWEVGAQVDDLVRSTNGELIAEPAGFAVRNGREVYLQPIDLRAEQLQGRWQPKPLVEALSTGRFQRVVTVFNLFPLEAEAAIAQHFTLTDTLVSPDKLTFRVYDFHS